MAALLALLALAAPAWAAPGPKEVVVTSPRVHLGDLVSGADAQSAAVDLGPAPAAGGSRLVTRADMAAALGARGAAVPLDLPDAVRVVRKAKHLAQADMNVIVGEAVSKKPLGRGVTLSAVRADRAVDVADGWTRVDVEVPRAPKKVGPFAATAIASFFAGDDVVARISVPLELAVSEDGAVYDALRGAEVTLIIRRNLVEIRAAGFAGADADIGDPIPIQLRPSGRVVRARLSSKDEAIAIESTSPFQARGFDSERSR